MYKYIVSISMLLLLSGCHKSTKYADILNRADELINSKPDSAASLLNKIDAPENLPPSAKADYGYLKNLAYKKIEKPNMEDSIILFTMDYYKNNNNTGRLSRTYELTVSYYNQKNDTTNALKTAREGLQYNIEMNDSAEIARSYDILAEAYLNDKDYKTTIKNFKMASLYDTQKPAWRDYMIGLYYHFIFQADSSAFFIQNSINSALAQRDTFSASHFIRNQADIFYDERKYAESLSAIKKLKDINPNLSAKSYLTFAASYLMLHQLDSAQTCLDIADKLKFADKGDIYWASTNNRIRALQAIVDYSKGKHVDWSKMGRYNDSICNDNYTKIQRIEEESDIHRRLEQKNLMLTIDRQRIMLALVSVSLLAVIFVFIFIYFNQKKKEKIEVLQSMMEETMRNSNVNREDRFFKKMLLQQLGLVRFVATTPTAQNQALLKQISHIANKDIAVEELLNWDDLYHTIDSIYNNFYTRLLQNYGSVLNDREIQLCCLLCAEFSTKEISVVTQQSVRTVYQRKTTIRQKLAMDEKDDIVEFINKACHPALDAGSPENSYK